MYAATIFCLKVRGRIEIQYSHRFVASKRVFINKNVRIESRSEREVCNKMATFRSAIRLRGFDHFSSFVHTIVRKMMLLLANKNLSKYRMINTMENWQPYVKDIFNERTSTTPHHIQYFRGRIVIFSNYCENRKTPYWKVSFRNF